MSPLANIIVSYIRQHGEISFRDFMEMALYYPKQGYYTSECEKFGAEGDFFTSPMLTPVFGEMLSLQLTEMWKLLGENHFTIVEIGAGSGLLCKDILKSLHENRAFYSALDYMIVEKSPSLRKNQQAMLPDKVQWIDHISKLPSISGCILSNELVDNFAVHAVAMENELMEVYVGYQDKFHGILKPARENLKEYFKEQQIQLPKGYRTEVNLEATRWIGDISKCLKEGFVLTIDYGCTAEELYSPRKIKGSLHCYHQHQMNEDPFSHIGKQDITAFVNFTALKLWGLKNNLLCNGYTTQASFLRSLGILTKVRELETTANPELHRIRNIGNVIFKLGEKIKVMVQQKGGRKLSLTGMQFPMPI